MEDIKRNIWTLYKFLLLTSSLLFAYILYLQYKQVEDSHLEEQYNSIQLFSNGTTSLLDNQEMVLDMLADSLLSNQSNKTPQAHQEWLKELSETNPNIAAFGLADPQGNIKLVSANLEISSQPNLLKQATTRDSFLKTLSTYKMVVGRSYYKTDIEELILPIRKAIRDSNGNVIAVMTAGLKLDSSKLFNIELHNNEEHLISLVRDDLYVQYMATSEYFPIDYSKPFEKQDFMHMLRKISQVNQITLSELKGSTKPVCGYVFDQDTPASYSVKYLPRYNLWAISRVTVEHIITEYVETFIVYIFIYLLLQLTFYNFVRSIDKDETARRQELLFQAHHDPITSLPNRHYLLFHVKKWFSNPSKPASVLFLDIDKFKRVNDSAGHKVGDQVLKLVSTRLQQLIAADTLLIRETGDEFLIVTLETDTFELERLAQRIVHNFSQSFNVDQFSFILSCSIGIARFPEQGTNLDDLKRSADIAMYHAKNQRSSISFFTPSMQTSYLEEITLEQKLRRAISNRQLTMVYQPQFNAAGSLHGVEALVRWCDPDLGFIPPDKFIPIAENFGLMPSLGQLIMETTLQEMHALQQNLGFQFQTSVNISVRQLVRSDFLDKLLVCVQESHYNQRFLTLEITENLFIEDRDNVRPLFDSLNKLGIRISLDDFGTGYSSLSMLGELPFDEIKIDKSFVDNILTDDKSLKMAQNIIAIAKNFDRDVVAEGIELEQHQAILRQCGCDLFQGYYYAKPMNFDCLKGFLITNQQSEPLTEA